MTRKRLVFGLSAAALVTLAALGGVAYASSTASPEQEDERGEIAAINGARVSLAQAVGIAERQGGGKAMEASFDDETGGRWEVEIAAGQTVRTFAVDMTTGTASAMTAEADEGAEEND
ncbi:hypothetical protein [Brevundimonas sp.]|uniref:PepSY domain-containing protein n=1 Tax=Brevundimonas sp. TaxID=1871086 RepID=UPI0025B7F335|nr:hypothetical protein [Brevundimonas sp.]